MEAAREMSNVVKGILSNKILQIGLIVLGIGLFGYLALDINGAQNTLTNAGEDMMDDILDAGEAASAGVESLVQWAVTGVTYQFRNIQVFFTNGLTGILNRATMFVNDIIPGTSWDIPMIDYMD